jgi:hypothetical protein
MCTVFMLTTSKPKLYNPRQPERTLRYQTVAEHHETWLALYSAQTMAQASLTNVSGWPPHLDSPS